MNFDFFQFLSTINPLFGIDFVLQISCFCISFVMGSELEIILPLLSVIMIVISVLAINSEPIKSSAACSIVKS